MIAKLQHREATDGPALHAVLGIDKVRRQLLNRQPPRGADGGGLFVPSFVAPRLTLGPDESAWLRSRDARRKVKRAEARDMVDEIAGLFKDEKLRGLFVENATGKLS